jgi:hypothetical protein
MTDPENLEQALELLEELLEADPAPRRRERDDSALQELLALRLVRAAAEVEEAARGSDAPSPARPDMQAIVREIVLRDLVANSGTTQGGRMISECDEVVLCRTEVSALLQTNCVRRRYAILDPAGRGLGEVHQLSNPSRPELAPRPILEIPDLRFHVLDRTIGRTFAFQRSGDQLYILDEVDTQLGFVHFKSGEVPASYRVISSLDRGMIQAKAAPERPFALQVFGSTGDEIGMIERRFVGLGPFLDDTNRQRIRFEPERVSPGQRWGLVATALLAGVDDEACNSG